MPPVCSGSPLSSIHSSSAFSDLSSSDYSSEDETGCSRSRLHNQRLSRGVSHSSLHQPQPQPPRLIGLAYDSSSSSAFGSAPSVDRISFSMTGSSSASSALGLSAVSDSISTTSGVAAPGGSGGNWSGAATESFSSSTVSAEVVALNLLRKFSEHQLPRVRIVFRF